MPRRRTDLSPAADVRIGISGWTYKPWRGSFYPDDLKIKQELHYAGSQFSSIEINGTFYSLQRPTSFESWYGATPKGFVFAIKGPRFITHMKRLVEIQTPLANFLASGLLRLNEKLGPILWQFPESFHFTPERFESFFKLLPRSTAAALALAKKHDARLKGRSWLRIDKDRPLRHAVEIRHSSFETPAFVKLLRRHRIALVVADTAGKWPLMEDVTADFVYVRLHGDKRLYVSGYSQAALKRWAGKISDWSKGAEGPAAHRAGATPKKAAHRDVCVYFDNDVKVRAPFDAAKLAYMLGRREAPLRPYRPLKGVTEQPRDRWPGMTRR